MKKYKEAIEAAFKKLVDICKPWGVKYLGKPGAFLFLAIVNPLFIVFWSAYSRMTTDERFKKEGKPFGQIKSKSYLFWMSGLVTLFALMSANYIVSILRYLVNLLVVTLASIREGGNPLSRFDWNAFNLTHLVDFRLLIEAPIFIVPVFAILAFVYNKRLKKSYDKRRDYNHNEKGDDRLITEKELRKTYTKIPNRGKRFAGYGGIPVAHELKQGNLSSMALKSKMICHFPRMDFENKTKKNADEFEDVNNDWRMRTLAKYGKILTSSEKCLKMTKEPSGSYYIEQDTVNSIVVGMTRSGKGESKVNPMVDILSRAQNQSSMVIADPKGELYQMSYKTLVKRGYNVQVLNYQNVDFSMSYNPLQRAIQYAQKGYYEKVQTEVDVVAESLYRQAKAGGGGNDKFWEESSMLLFSALSMAQIWRAKETGEWDTVTIPNMIGLLNQLGSEFVYVDSEGKEAEPGEQAESDEKKSRITIYFDRLRRIGKSKPSPFLTMADNAFRQSGFAGEETKGSIYSSFLQGLKLFANDSIGRMSSESNLDVTTLGFPRQLSIQLKASSDDEADNPYVNQVAMLSILDKNGKAIVKPNKVIVDVAGYVNYAIEPKLPKDFTVNIEMVRSDARVRFNARKQYDKIKSIVIDKAYTKGFVIENKHIEIKYSEKPTAVFLVIPPNKKAFGAMVSLFVDQVFNANYDMAGDGGRKTVFRVHFVLDEFGNLPMIPAMETKLSIGLGIGLLFTMFLQNLEQLDAVYGKETAETIFGNCSVTEYIKSVSPQTMEKFEKASGVRTITTRTKNLSGQGVSVNHTQEQQPLITQNQLQKLQSGESFIAIGVKGEERSGKKTSNYPILVTGKFEFPYRYMFLYDEFDQSNTIADIPVRSKHRNLKLSTIAVDWTESNDQLFKYYEQLEKNNNPNPLAFLARNKLKKDENEQDYEEEADFSLA